MTGPLVVLLVLSAAVLAVSTRWLITANPAGWMPYLKNPPVVPRGAIGLRVLGAGMAVFCSIVADLPSAWWAAFVVLLAWLPSLVIHLWHNVRVRTSGDVVWVGSTGS